METHRNLITMTQQFLLGVVPGLDHTDVMLHAAPISHASGAFMFPHLAVGAGNAFPLSRRFEAAKFFEAVELYGVTTTKLVPTMLNILVTSGLAGNYDLKSLRYIAYGGAPIFQAQLQAALDTFGPVLVQNYGQGEAPSTCAALSREEHVVGSDPDRLRRLGSVGRELPGVRLRIADSQNRTLPPGEQGEILVRSDLVMRGYWNQPEASAETLRDGWLHTGDVGYLDEGGYLFITSRIKDMIISGGFNIYAREVEDVICDHPDVKDAAVIGRPDPKWGETVFAVIVCRDGAVLTEEAVTEHCLGRMASYKKPQAIAFVPSLPVNATGKVDKNALRARYANGAATS
jgi:acyl-CoA synthetase (AMP-forming)/AMP-acid ligase II